MMLGMVWILSFGMISFGVFCFCRVRYGTDSLARRGMLRFALLGFGLDSKVWWRTVGRGKVCCCKVRFGFCTAVRHGDARSCKVRILCSGLHGSAKAG